MTFDPVVLEVDRTLRNPIVLAAVASWTIALAILFWGVLRIAQRWWVVAILACVSLALTPVVQIALVNLFYRQRFNGVGLWGRPPVWLAPLAAVALVVLWKTLTRRRAVDAA